MTLGISPGVSSCTDPVAAAICWPRTLSSLRKAIAECICYLLIVAAGPASGAAWLSPPGPWGCCIPASASFRNLDLHDLRDLGMADLDGGGNEPPPKSPAQSFVPRAARALATASYSVPAVTPSACSVWFELWMMTVPLLGVTKEI